MLQDWRSTEAGGYWREDPNDSLIRWHVSKMKAYMVGSVAGQIIQKTGYYWYTIDFNHNQSKATPMIGPFDTELEAQEDCNKRAPTREDGGEV